MRPEPVPEEANSNETLRESVTTIITLPLFEIAFLALFEFSIQHLGIVPKAYVEKVGDAEFAKHPIEQVLSWIDYQQDVMSMLAAEDHTEGPQVKTLNCKFLTDGPTIIAMFKFEADVVQIPF
jgi:hypothetical protein